MEVDDFIAKLWDIHATVKEEGYTQVTSLCSLDPLVYQLSVAFKTLNLGLFRSDYMIHVDSTGANPTPEIRQVEFNTIASSFGGLGAKVSELHL